MMQFTRSSSCLLTESDEDDIYMAWDNMEFDIIGNITDDFIPVEQVCKDKENLTRVIFPGSISKHFKVPT